MKNRKYNTLQDKGCLSFLVYVLDDTCTRVLKEALEVGGLWRVYDDDDDIYDMNGMMTRGVDKKF